MADQVDKSPDAALVESNERAANAHTLSTEDAIAALTGGKGAPDDEIPAEGSLSWQEAEDEEEETPDHQSDTAAEIPVGSEESDDQEDDSSSEDTDDSTNNESDEEDTESAEDAEDELGDFYIGLGDDDEIGLHVSKADTPSGVPVPKGSLSDGERAHLWQSKADKYAAESRSKDKTIAEKDATISELRSTIASLTAKSGNAFDKTPESFMPAGEVYDHEDRSDPTTPSGRAYAQYAEAYHKHDRETLKAEIKAEQEMLKQQEAQQQMHNAQLQLLRAKRPNDFKTDADVEDLIKWSTTVGDKGLYALSIARDIMTGQFRLPPAVIKQLAAKAQPKNGQHKSSIATKPEAKVAPTPKVSSDVKTLQTAGFLDAREGY